MGQDYSHHDLNNPNPFNHPPTDYELSQLPNEGLYYSSENLEKINDIYTKTTYELAKYADYVTRGSCNERWMETRILNIISKYSTDIKLLHGSPNIRAMGNIAYMAINCHNYCLRNHINIFLDRLRRIKTYRRKTI